MRDFKLLPHFIIFNFLCNSKYVPPWIFRQVFCKTLMPRKLFLLNHFKIIFFFTLLKKNSKRSPQWPHQRKGFCSERKFNQPSAPFGWESPLSVWSNCYWCEFFWIERWIEWSSWGSRSFVRVPHLGGLRWSEQREGHYIKWERKRLVSSSLLYWL